ncbi:MAG: laccase domain-containing protein [Actinobacteria bacterium]|nr:laccase domain-containing protein [Actinomycetota bacterium]
MKVYHETGKDMKALINRRKFLNKLGMPENKVVSAKSIHGDNVEIVLNEDCGSYISETDGLITNQKNVYLSITVADCLPFIIFEPLKETICLIHWICTYCRSDKYFSFRRDKSKPVQAMMVIAGMPREVKVWSM